METIAYIAFGLFVAFVLWVASRHMRSTEHAHRMDDWERAAAERTRRDE